jgi:hypothetical protein
MTVSQVGGFWFVAFRGEREIFCGSWGAVVALVALRSVR